MAFTNPFTGERIGMIVVAAAALLVMLPSVLMVCRRKLSLAVTLVLSLLYGLMFLAGGYVGVSAEQANREHYENAVDRTNVAIQRRIETYVNLLRGGAGLFATSTHISRK